MSFICDFNFVSLRIPCSMKNYVQDGHECGMTADGDWHDFVRRLLVETRTRQVNCPYHSTVPVSVLGMFSIFRRTRAPTKGAQQEDWQIIRMR